MKVQRRGLAVDVPAGWDVRVSQRASADGDTANPVMHLATFPLPDRHGDFGSGAVERMRPDDVLVVLFEYDQEACSTPLFATRGRPRLKPGDFSTRQLQRTLPGQSGVQYFYSEGGRAFCLYVVLGSHARRAELVPLVSRLLAGLTVAARPAAGTP